MIPFGEWLPDQPDLRAPGLAEARNVVPLDAGDYGPWRSHAPTSTALPATCRGFGSGRSSGGAITVIAGTESKLYRQGALGAWTDVSTGGGTYTLASGARWRFCDFGSTLIAVGGLAVSPQAYDLALGGTFALLDSDDDAPAAQHAAVVRDFVMLGHTKVSSDDQPERLWWSAIGDPTNWPTPASATAAAVQSGRQNLPDSGWIRGIVPAVGGADAIVLCEDGVWRLTYVGPPVIFEFVRIEQSRGAYADGSIVAIGPLVFYLADDGLFVCDGVQSAPIGAGRVDRWLLNDLDHNYKDNMWAAADADRKLIIWAYPGPQNRGGRCNRILCYNYVTKRFSRAETDVEAMGVLFSSGYTLEDIGALYPALDEVPYSLDDRFWAGGASYLGAFDRDHKLGAYAGPPLEAEIELADAAPADGMPAFCNALQPFCDAPAPELRLGTRNTLAEAVSYQTYRPVGSDRRLRQRARGRFVRAGVRMAAGADWSHAQGLEIAMRANGRR